MAEYLDLHPQNPQPRLIQKVVECLNKGGVIAYPTTSGYALGCKLGNLQGVERIRQIRKLEEKTGFYFDVFFNFTSSKIC